MYYNRRSLRWTETDISYERRSASSRHISDKYARLAIDEPDCGALICADALVGGHERTLGCAVRRPPYRTFRIRVSLLRSASQLFLERFVRWTKWRAIWARDRDCPAARVVFNPFTDMNRRLVGAAVMQVDQSAASVFTKRRRRVSGGRGRGSASRRRHCRSRGLRPSSMRQHSGGLVHRATADRRAAVSTGTLRRKWSRPRPVQREAGTHD